MKNVLIISFLIVFSITNAAAAAGIYRIVINGPGLGQFGLKVAALPNGNIVVTDPGFSPSDDLFSAGAVYLYDGKNGALISQLTGSHKFDGIGESITVLPNGNFLVSSYLWGFGADNNVGAVTFCNGTTGCNGPTTLKNSLVGSTPEDGVSQVRVLTNGNYLVVTPGWDNGGIVDAGAITFCSGTTGCQGVVTAANSLYGAAANETLGQSLDPFGRGVLPLANGNYVVDNWKANGERGTVTFGNGTTGITGMVSAANSLVGVNPGDRVGFNGALDFNSILALPNGNYVVSSSNWNGLRGASTLCNGQTGCIGTVSSANSLTGTNSSDEASNFPAVALPNGNYVVLSTLWNSGLGAATYCNGTTGCTGEISSANSFIGSNSNDPVGQRGIVILPNGNYVMGSATSVTWVNGSTGIIGVLSEANSLTGVSGTTVGPFAAVLPNSDYVVKNPNWNGTRGAATLCSGGGGCTGTVTAANSVTGATSQDFTGNIVIALTNGNYVVGSPRWHNGALQNAGAATFCTGGNSCAGQVVSPANSLVGDHAGDFVCSSRSLALTNGNYVIVSDSWNGSRGAATWGSGTTGVSGLISSANSLTGDSANDQVGSQGAIPLTSGNYVINSSNWDSDTATNAGAVTWGNGFVGTMGNVSATNSLVGTRSNDNVGFDGFNQGSGGGVHPTLDGAYTVKHSLWDNGVNQSNAGAVTLGKANAPIAGPLTDENSVRSFFAGEGSSGISYAYDAIHKQLVVGQRTARTVTLFRYTNLSVPFDYDGDGKSDISLFRPSIATWFAINSLDGAFSINQWGSNGDKTVPADYDGDGKTDLAIWRPSNGVWFWINSSNNTVGGNQFGLDGDIPAPADYDGDGKADIMIYRPSGGQWWTYSSSNSNVSVTFFGSAEDKPTIGDFDGDGMADVALFRPSNGTWYRINSSTGNVAINQFGLSGDKPVAGDYDSDGKSDLAIYRPSGGAWYWVNSASGTIGANAFGLSEDQPAPGDYDGDGKSDLAVYRPSQGAWYLLKTTQGFSVLQFGTAEDIATPGSYAY